MRPNSAVQGDPTSQINQMMAKQIAREEARERAVAEKKAREAAALEVRLRYTQHISGGAIFLLRRQKLHHLLTRPVCPPCLGELICCATAAAGASQEEAGPLAGPLACFSLVPDCPARANRRGCISHCRIAVLNLSVVSGWAAQRHGSRARGI